MTRWALIQGIVVANVVEQDSPPAIPGQWVECGDAGPGWHYVEGVFSDPFAPPPAPPPPPHVSVGAFKDRLGMDAHAIAVSTHPACVAAREALVGRKYVDLVRPDVAALLDLLIATNQPAANALFPGSGPITAEKKAAILTAPVLGSERP